MIAVNLCSFVSLLAVVPISHGFLLDDPSTFVHQPKQKIYEFNFEITWESSLIYFDNEETSWVCITKHERGKTLST